MSHGASHGDLSTALYGSVDERSFVRLGKSAQNTRVNSTLLGFVASAT